MNTNIFDESNVEVLDTNEDNNFIYESIHIKNLGHTFKTRTKKSKLKRTNETVPQIHIEDFIVSSGMAKEANKETMEAFFKTPAIKMQRAKIEIDSDSGDTWMDFDALSRGLALAVKTPKYTELSWNARGEGLLYIAGLISVTDGAILANFLFNDHQFSSIAETNGVSNILLNGEDGSGHLASGNVIWDAIGNLSINGYFQSNGSGNRITIDPNTRTIKMIDKFDSVLVEMSFYDYGSNETGAEIIYKSYDANRSVNSSMRFLGGTLTLYHGDVDQGYNYASILHDGKTRFSLDPDQMPNRNEAYHSQMYLDGETLKVKRS